MGDKKPLSQTNLKFLKKKPQDFILSNGKNYSATQMVSFAFEYFKLDFNDYIVKSEKFLRKKDIKHKFSDYNSCLMRNEISRKDLVYGKRMRLKASFIFGYCFCLFLYL